MKKNKGFSLMNVCGAQVLVPMGSETINLDAVFHFNETTTYIWNNLPEGKDFSADDVAALLEAEYEVDHETALKDSKMILEEMKKAGILSE